MTPVALLLTQAELLSVTPADVLPVSGDPEDDYVLAAALAGKADYLVTGDKKLRRLGTYHGTELASPRAFLDSLS